MIQSANPDTAAARPWAKAWADGPLAAFRCWFGGGQAPNISPNGEGLPLIIGVTGHRDIPLEDVPAIKESLRRIFRDLGERCPHTPLLLLSPLAEGADRLAAEVFLELPGTRLMVPMPLELNEYRKTFSAEDAKFDELLRRAEKYYRIPRPQGPHIAMDGPPPDFGRSPYSYQALGGYLNEHSHILIAVWDKAADGKAGGTASVVKARLSGRPELRPSLAEELSPDVGRPVIHIWARRQKPGSRPPIGGAAEEHGSIHFISPDKNIRQQVSLLKLGMDRLDSFNREAPAAGNGSPGASLTDVLLPHEKRISAISETAAALAQQYGQKEKMALGAMFGGGILATVTLLGFSLVNSWPLLAVSLFAVICIFTVFGILKIQGWQNKHLCYRGLRENTRVLVFWSLAGLRLNSTQATHRTEQAADYGETRWLRQALIYADLCRPAVLESLDDGLAAQRMETVKTHWIEQQKRYFEKAAAGQGKKDRVYFTSSLILLVSGTAAFLSLKFLGAISPASAHLSPYSMKLLLSIIMIPAALGASARIAIQFKNTSRGWIRTIFLVCFLAVWFVLAYQYPLPNKTSAALSALTDLALALAAIFAYYSHVSAFKANAKRYAEYQALFTSASQLYDEAETKTDALPSAIIKRKQDIAEALGRYALQENSDWLCQHLKRPVELFFIA